MHVQAVFIPFIFVRMEEKGKILIIDDNKDVLFALNLLLEPYMQKVKVTTQPARIEYFMRTFQPDVVLLDMNFHRDAVSGQEGFEYLGQILEIDPQAVVIFMTAYSDIEKAVKAIKVGATDFISKPWETEKLLATLSSGIRLSHSRKEVGRLREQMKAMKEDDTLPELIGESPAMLKVKDTIYKLVETDANILITGESGTGKDLVARLLRHYSPRRDDAFVTIDLGSIPEQLFESELFGYEKGAFTDARRSKPGRMEMASGGTLFLDEISEMDVGLQAKLLRALQQGEVQRVGSDTPIIVDVRVIAATNRNLREEVSEGRFREDLYYRLNVIGVEVPSLRERREDIPVLATAFLERFALANRKEIKGFTPQAMDALLKYSWPGNVRELENAVERAPILCLGEYISERELPMAVSSAPKNNDAPTLAELQGAAGEEPISMTLDEMERAAILRTLQDTGDNKSEAARRLGITRATLHNKLRRYDME
mgnify:CR=1 FL=1